MAYTGYLFRVSGIKKGSDLQAEVYKRVGKLVIYLFKRALIVVF